MNGVEGVISGKMEDLVEYDREAASLVEYIAALNQGDRDILEEIHLTFKTTDIWGDKTEEHWHFRPCVGGYVVDGLRESDSRKGLSSLPRCCSRGTWGGVKATPISTIYRYIKATV